LIGALPPTGTAPQIGEEVKDIDAGGNTLLVLRTDGQIAPLLRTNNGAVLPWTVISRSKVHSLAIDSEGQMFGWGDNGLGQLPARGYQFIDIPLKGNPPPGGGRWTNVCAGIYISMAVANGRLYSWGREGWTGSSSYAPYEPRPVDMPEDEIGWLDMSAGSAAALALSARGNLYMWGLNEKPRKVEGLPSLLDANATATYVAFDPLSLRVLNGLTAGIISGTEAPMIVQFSGDLVNWQTVSNFVNAVGKTSVTVPATQSGNLFMRVRSE
jgi:alpha-tubulin suppressor-like RCC1 family protein